MRACKVVPQGRELKTLAVSINEMLVIGVAVFHINFFFLPRLRIFLSGTHFFQGIRKVVFRLSTFPTFVISKASEIEENM